MYECIFTQMGKDMEQKTNVMRLRDQAKINYKSYYYKADGTTTGEEVAAILSQTRIRCLKHW